MGVEVPRPGPGEVRIRVHHAGLNPVDFKIFGGAPTRYPPALPSGNGNDFSGVVDALGGGVTEVAVGDEVFGGARFRAQADHLILSAALLSQVPTGLPLETAGALDIAGRTAWAAIQAVRPGPADTVLVGAAAGGVGILATQLAVRAGATVIGTAGDGNAALLRRVGAIPVRYGEGLVERVRAVSPDGVTAVLDNAGRGTVEAGLALGARPDRINTIADAAAIATYGVRNEGGHTLPGSAELRRLAGLIAVGEVILPIAARYPLDRVRDAYAHLMTGHLAGKIVLDLR